MMEYKGYVGSVIFDHEAGILHGRVVNIKDVITFQGESVAQTRQAFHDSVEDYLEFCAERGEAPEKPMSGKFNVRIEPRLHARAVAVAESQGVSLNNLVEQAIERVVNAPVAPSNAQIYEQAQAEVFVVQEQLDNWYQATGITRFTAIATVSTEQVTRVPAAVAT
jgi:predicted HicB family RNase H-like nuclease